MRRLMIMLLAACLLGISASPAVVAQSPSPESVGFGKRVEVPEMGFAATFPEGWVVETTFGEARVVSPDGSTRCLPTGHRVDQPIDDPAAALDLATEVLARKSAWRRRDCFAGKPASTGRPQCCAPRGGAPTVLLIDCECGLLPIAYDSPRTTGCSYRIGLRPSWVCCWGG